jgi:predicted branched-subunit amino acid permease
MAVGLIGSGASTTQIIVATFLLNFRHFLMSASLSSKTGEQRRWILALLSFGITDETFAVASAERGTLSSLYLGALEAGAWTSWLVGSAAGFAAGGYLPERLGSAMGVALYALFAALIVPQIDKRWTSALLAATAGLLHLGFRATAISDGWAFVFAVVIAAGIGSFMQRSRWSQS